MVHKIELVYFILLLLNNAPAFIYSKIYYFDHIFRASNPWSGQIAANVIVRYTT